MASFDIPRSDELVTYVRDCKSSGIPIEICYQCFGDPKAGNPVVLLVCGLNMQLYAWDESFCEDLVRAGFFVIRYDNRDIGHSTKVEQIGSVVAPRLLLPDKWATFFGERLPYSIESMARDGLALLDALGVERAHVFGISMGGAIAQTIAILAPHRIMSLTSLMSSTNAHDLPDPQMSVKLWMLRQPPKGCTIDELLDFRVHSLRHLLKHALPVDGAYLKARYLMSLERSSYSAGLVRQAAALRRTVPRDEALRHMMIPALVIHGGQDVVVPPIHGYRTAQCLPHSRLLVFRSMGHYFHPAFFPAIVTAFADMAEATRSVGGSPLKGTQLYYSFVAGFVPPSSRRVADTASSDRAGDAAISRGDTDVDMPFPTSGTNPATTAKVEAAPNGLSPTTATATVSNSVTASLQGKIDLTNAELMASIGPYLFPMVTSIYSKTGKAAIALVNTAIPISGTIPVPEAVLLDLHEPPPCAANGEAATARRSPTSAQGGLGGVGRVQGLAVVAAKADTRPLPTASAATGTGRPASSATTAMAPPSTPAVVTAPETTAAAAGGGGGGPARAPVAPSRTPTSTPATTVTDKLSRWWGSVVAKATTAASAPSTTALNVAARPATEEAVTHLDGHDKREPETASTHATATTEGSAIDKLPLAPQGARPAHPPQAKPEAPTLEVEDVVEPFVPGSPSTWNKARFPDTMSAKTAPTRDVATSSPPPPRSSTPPAANEESSEDDSSAAPHPIQLVGVPLSTHLQRLQEREQARRLLAQQRKEQEQREKKAAAVGQSGASASTRGPQIGRQPFSSPLADKRAKGTVPAPGVVTMVAVRPHSGKAGADSVDSHGSAPQTVNRREPNSRDEGENEEAPLQPHSAEGPDVALTDLADPAWSDDADGQSLSHRTDEEDGSAHTRAASTYDIAATLLAPVLPTETDDMVISALPSPTEQEIESARRSQSSTP